MTLEEIGRLCAAESPRLVVRAWMVDPRRGRMRLALRDGTYLDAHQLGADRYSYHWQRPGETVRRNNAPHFNHIDTALHHLHIGQEVRASPVRGVSEQDVRQVLRFIQSQIEGD